MSAQLHQLSAALYLVAGLVAWVGMAQRSARLERVSVRVLALAALFHLPALALLHREDSPPPLTDPAMALSFMAWIGVLAFLVLERRARLAGLTVLVAPVAFVGVFAAALRLPAAAPATFAGAGSWPHAHVLLASAGFALFGLSGLAGVLFLAEHRRLKAKRPLDAKLPLPSLEALDRVNRVALAMWSPGCSGSRASGERPGPERSTRPGRRSPGACVRSSSRRASAPIRARGRRPRAPSVASSSCSSP
jgi:ABC-type uncharacterized transport system permease subunit